MFGWLRKWIQDAREDAWVDGQLTNLTPRARMMLWFARREADRLGHRTLKPEHLLLGLIKLKRSVGNDVLRKLGIDLRTVQMEIENALCQKDEALAPADFRIKLALARAAQEAKELRHYHVGTEHILLGLLGNDVGQAGHVLARLGVDAKRLRQAIQNEVDPAHPTE